MKPFEGRCSGQGQPGDGVSESRGRCRVMKTLCGVSLLKARASPGASRGQRGAPTAWVESEGQEASWTGCLRAGSSGSGHTEEVGSPVQPAREDWGRMSEIPDTERKNVNVR